MAYGQGLSVRKSSNHSPNLLGVNVQLGLYDVQVRRSESPELRCTPLSLQPHHRSFGATKFNTSIWTGIENAEPESPGPNS